MNFRTRDTRATADSDPIMPSEHRSEAVTNANPFLSEPWTPNRITAQRGGERSKDLSTDREVLVGVDLLRANLALMSILRSASLPISGRIEVSSLRAKWVRYALRRHDLECSILSLDRRAFIKVDYLRGQQYVVLTAAGYRWIHSLMGFVESMMTWSRRIAGEAAALRRARRADNRCRRLTDQARSLQQDAGK